MFTPELSGPSALAVLFLPVELQHFDKLVGHADHRVACGGLRLASGRVPLRTAGTETRLLTAVAPAAVLVDRPETSGADSDRIRIKVSV